MRNLHYLFKLDAPRTIEELKTIEEMADYAQKYKQDDLKRLDNSAEELL